MGVQARLKKERHAVNMNAQTEADRLPKWTPFERVTPKLDPARREALIRDIMRLADQRNQPMTRASVETMVDEKMTSEMWMNSRYTVIVLRDEPQAPDMPKMIHLSIRRNDRTRPREERYRDFQRIKSELVGPNNEGVELYPAEDRVADCADQYHLYVLEDPTLQFWFGFTEGFRAGPQSGSPATQSSFEEE
jgi:hypothetical protein